jgi:hypothetical protein
MKPQMETREYSTPRFASQQDRERYEKLVAEQRRKQAVPLEVTQGCSIEVIRDDKVVVLTGGCEVFKTDFISQGPYKLQQLISGGIVLEASEGQLRAARAPRDARFIVVSSIITRSANGERGIIREPGEAVTADDCGGEANLNYFVLKGCVTDRGPQSNGGAARRPPKSAA